MCVFLCARERTRVCALLLQPYSIQPERVVTNEHWQRQTRCLSAHHNRRILKRLAISVKPQSLLSRFNTFAHQKDRRRMQRRQAFALACELNTVIFPMGISKWSYTKRNESAIHDALSPLPRTTQIHAEPAYMHNYTHANTHTHTHKEMT